MKEVLLPGEPVTFRVSCFLHIQPAILQGPNRVIIRRACNFSIFSCFLHIQPTVFQAPRQSVILSEALRRSIANSGLYSAESKDPGNASWQMLLGAFRPQTPTEDKKEIKRHDTYPPRGCFGSRLTANLEGLGGRYKLRLTSREGGTTRRPGSAFALPWHFQRSR